MKKVMHVIGGLATGGAEMMLYKLLCNRTEFDESVICLKDSDTPIARNITGMGVTVHGLGFSKTSLNIGPLRRLRQIVDTERPDIIHGWMYHGNIASVLVRSWAPQAKVIWNVRHSLHDIAKETLLVQAAIQVNRLFTSIPEVIVYNSQTSAKQHEAFGFSGSKTRVIPNGFDDGLFAPDPESRSELRKRFGVNEGELLLGLVARFHTMKGHRVCMQAAKILRDEKGVKKFRLLFIGAGLDSNNRQMVDLVGELGLSDTIHLLGEQSNLQELTCGFDIAISSSLWGEGFSNSIGEAMSCGVPCVVTDVGDSAWIVDTAGASVPPGAPGALAGALETLIQMTESERSELGVQARKRIQDNFSMGKVSSLYAKLYREVLST